MTQGLLIDVPAHNGNTDENQRYTTRHAVSWCRRTAGGVIGSCIEAFTLDVAACEEAHHAALYYDGKRRGDGLKAPWFGDVFCNPPWDDIESWVLRAWDVWKEPIDEHRPHSVAMLLPGDRTHRLWWQRWVEPYREGHRSIVEGVALSVHFPPERFAYGGPGNPTGVGVGEPFFTSVLLVWRRAP